MAFRSAALATALIMLVGGVLAGHMVLTAIISDVGGHRSPSAAAGFRSARPTSRPQPSAARRRAATPAPRKPTAEATPASPAAAASTRRSASPTPAPVVAGGQASVGMPAPPAAVQLPLATGEEALTSYAPPPPPANPSGGIVLVNYWIGVPRAQRGRTVSIDYVIDNETGNIAHLLLGASIKSSANTADWAAAAINDPAHDVVASVPPGTTIHMRYFSLSTSLRPGVYDVAWGLRDAETGRRVGLVAAAGALRVLG